MKVLVSMFREKAFLYINQVILVSGYNWHKLTILIHFNISNEQKNLLQPTILQLNKKQVYHQISTAFNRLIILYIIWNESSVRFVHQLSCPKH